MDFTLGTYKDLLLSLKNNRYSFIDRNDLDKSPLVIIRHDVDRLPQNALKMAKLENSLGVKSIYYFRIVPHVYKPEIIRQIAALGHAIGYHYEDIDLAIKSLKSSYCKSRFKIQRFRVITVDSKLVEKDIINEAIKFFDKNLQKIRKLYPVKTICMHGSPLSKYDNRLLWKYYNYRDYNIEFEPYFDLDYNEVFYITDTGRQWNNESISVRDKVSSGFNIKIKSTQNLIKSIESNQLPHKIMINTHPHRWFNAGLGWVKELIIQNTKNLVKYYLIKRREQKTRSVETQS